MFGCNVGANNVNIGQGGTVNAGSSRYVGFYNTSTAIWLTCQSNGGYTFAGFAQACN
jgi:hypothetical protein